MEQLAAERLRSCRELAQQRRQARRQRALRRARRMERTAERRMIDAWRRAAELRAKLESSDC
jgi:vacuolar-type H+-ATPase subunit E/Vma4